MFNLVLKVGNSGEAEADLKDGMVVTMLPGNEPLSEQMSKVFAIVRCREELRTRAVLGMDAAVDAQGNILRARAGYVDLDELAERLGNPGLVAEWRGPGAVPVQDGSQLQKTIIRKSVAHMFPPVEDENSISSGSWTVGSGGHYANWAAFFADIGFNLSGDLTGTQISDTTGEGAAFKNLSIGGGRTLKVTSNNPHGGDPTQGWTSTVASGQAIINLGFGGGGTFEVEHLRVRRTGGVGNPVLLFSNNDAVTLKLHDLLVDAGALAGADGIKVQDSGGAGVTTRLEMWNCEVWNGLSAGLVLVRFGSAVFIVENCTFDECYAGIQGNAEVFTARNCVAMRMLGSAFLNVGNATGYNNASDDASAADLNWATGSGNETLITPSNEFVSLTSSSVDYLRVRADLGGVCHDGGTTPTLAGNTQGIRGAARPHGSDVSIGASELGGAPVASREGLQGKQAQLDTAAFDRALTGSDINVQLALETLDDVVVLDKAKLSADDLNLAALTTTGDGQKATSSTVTSAPEGAIGVRVNGQAVYVANGPGEKASSPCYFSGDSGVTARAQGAVQIGDELYWNGSVAGWELSASTDKIDFVYEE